jgi:hypothetical protein
MTDNLFCICSEQFLLNKGPSYVSPQQTVNGNTRIEHKAELQATYDRVEHKIPTLADSSEFTEFLCAMNRITHTAYKRPNKPDQDIKAKKTPIMPSDKTKELIAMNENDYKNMLASELNPDNKVVRNCLPITSQQRINRNIMRIVERYEGTDVYKLLTQCKTSEPLPSVPYALPKDHKTGPLDVINLYGNIPLEDDTSTGIRGLITNVNDFFTLHKNETSISNISSAD